MSDVDRALAVLATGKRLAKEPNIYDFVNTSERSGPVDFRAYWRTHIAVKRIRAKYNRDLRQSQQIPCHVCERPFTRKRIDQIRCQDCISTVGSLRRRR